MKNEPVPHSSLVAKLLSLTALDKFNKANRKLTQKKIIFVYLFKKTATTRMLHVNTGIPISSICKIKRDLEKEGLLFEVGQKACKISGYKCWYLTTNPQFKNNHYGR